MGIKNRQRVERAIVRRVVADALAAGYALNVNNGGDTGELPAPSTSRSEIMRAMFAADDEHLIFYKDEKRVGWVWFIYGNGNDGADVISDHTVNLESVVAGARALADKYSK